MTDWHQGAAKLPDAASRAAAAARQDRLTKPQGSLGAVEALAIRLAAHQGTQTPTADRVAVVIFAADHGVADEGVSAFPPEVTGQMLANYVGGGAAISVLARALGASLTVVDMGTRHDATLPGVLMRKVAAGTRNIAVTSAMDAGQVDQALAAGAAVVDGLNPRPQLLVLGEMGIGNTTAAAAVAAALLGRDPSDLVGAGTGVSDEAIRHKAALIAAAFLREGVAEPIGAAEALRLVGGFEIAALAGAMVRAGQLGLTVVVDGFIASVAALAAVDLNPGAGDWMIFAHRSQERGHGLVLDALGAVPLLDMGLRLGEGSGAALAVPLIRLACALHNDMATFDEAAVSSSGLSSKSEPGQS